MRYLYPAGVPCAYYIGESRKTGTLPAGWYELISVNAGEAQLANVALYHQGQTSRFIVNAETLKGLRTYPDDSTLVGYLVDFRFRCPQCHANHPADDSQSAARIYGCNVRPYSQTCNICRRLILDGARTEGKPVELFPSDDTHKG